MDYVSKTIEYYNKNANKFIQGTYNADMSESQNIFLSYLNKEDTILDLGCGSGRDSKVFIDRGYNVTAIDGSMELSREASKVLGKEVINLRFEDIEFQNEFNGIWACASLVHISKLDLKKVFGKLMLALKENGVLYVSFKYGDFEGERSGRFFLDINENVLMNFVSEFKGLLIDKWWITGDVRKDRNEEKWLNAILIKKII